MPLQSSNEDLPHRHHRVLVAGTSGAGKTTLAARLAVVLGAPHVKIDALHHGPGWVPRPTFGADVERFSAAPAWVTEWQYGPVRALLADRADLLVWLDPPRRVVMRQVGARTLRRRLTRQRPWNGNVEPPLRTVLVDPDHIVRWAWRTHPLGAQRVGDLLARRPDLVVVRLGGRADAARWLDGALRRAVEG